MNPITGRAAGVEVAEALGIDLEGVRKITIVCEASDAACVIIEKYIDKEDVSGLADAIKKFVPNHGRWTELRSELERV